jgi:tetratricopeptide (TPR) repeat protein
LLAKKIWRQAWILGVLAGCVAESNEKPVTQRPASYLNKGRDSSACYGYLQQAKRKIKKGKLSEASRLINIALQSYPRMAKLHLMNGLIYEAMMDKGADDKSELVAVAYQNALSLDPTDFHAAYFMGRFRLKKKDYVGAQEYLAQALLLNPNDTISLHDLAVASYYAQDLEVARGSVQKLLSLVATQGKAAAKPLFYRTAAMVFAATGEKENAQKNLAHLVRLVGTNDPDINFLKRRMDDWFRSHTTPKLRAVAETDGDAPDSPPASEDPSQSSPFPNPAQPSQGLPGALPPGAAPEKPEKETQRVVILDCFLLRVSEETGTTKGSNILNNFTVGLTPQSAVSNNAKVNGVATLTQTFASNVTWGAIQYNLNIANAVDKRIEVIARPTLSTYEKKKSTFYSGETIKGGITGTTGGSIGEIQTGIALEVTPLEVLEDQNKTLLDISLEGSVLEGDPVQGVSLTAQTLTIAKTKATTTLKLKFGETGMLGGIYERVTTQNKSGFPILQDIPFLQYLFSQETTSDLRKYVVFFVTPRNAKAVRDAMKAPLGLEAQRKSQPNVRELLAKGGDWTETPSNISIIFKGVEKLGREFRTGDVIPLFWGTEPDWETHIDQVTAFLYF